MDNNKQINDKMYGNTRTNIQTATLNIKCIMRNFNLQSTTTPNTTKNAYLIPSYIIKILEYQQAIHAKLLNIQTVYNHNNSKHKQQRNQDWTLRYTYNLTSL